MPSFDSTEGKQKIGNDREQLREFFDNGEECIGHEYIVVPGMTVTMDFHVKLKKNIIPDLGEKIPNEESISPAIVRTTLQNWEKLGITSTIESLVFDREESTILLWGVHIPKKKTELETKKIKGEDHVEDVAFLPGTSNEISISFPRERDYGLLSRINGRFSPRELADLPQKKLVELIGGINRLSYRDKEYALEQVRVPLINYYTTLEIKTSFPADPKTRIDDSGYCMDILGTPLCLSLSVNPQKDNRFHIVGPWEIWDCR